MADWVGPINSGPAVGSAGAATSNTKTLTCMSGSIKLVMFRYNGTCPVGTIVTTLATSGDHAPAVTILTLTNTKPTTPLLPRLPAQDVNGANLLYAVGHAVVFPIMTDDHILLTVAGVNPGDSVDCWILFDDPRVFA